MNNAKIISVDPGIKTLGELNINEINLSRISRTISNPGAGKTSFKNALNFIFGINSRNSQALSSKVLAFRILAGTLFLALGAMTLTGTYATGVPELLGLTCCAFGVSLIAGFFMRVISACAAIFALYCSYISFMAGTVDSVSLMTAITAFTGCLFGPGLYSSDSFIRRSIFGIYRNMHRYDPERNADNLQFNYNAFASVESRIG